MGAEKKTNRLLPLTAFFLLVLSATIPCVFSAANQSPTYRKSAQLQKFGSSAVFPLHGNVYPLGYYSVSITIGHPAKRFDLDIDTGSQWRSQEFKTMGSKVELPLLDRACRKRGSDDLEAARP